jgi:hypothetical protein
MSVYIIITIQGSYRIYMYIYYVIIVIVVIVITIVIILIIIIIIILGSHRPYVIRERGLF